MTYAVIRSILFMSVFLKTNQAYNGKDKTNQVNNQSNILILYSIIRIPNPPSSPLSILSMSISVSVSLSLSMCVSYFVPIFVLCSYLGPYLFSFFFFFFATLSCDPCPRSVSYLCPAIRVLLSVSCNACPAICVLRSVFCDPCPAIHVLRSMSFDSCPANHIL